MTLICAMDDEYLLHVAEVAKNARDNPDRGKEHE
jgi:hypothetical protein